MVEQKAMKTVNATLPVQLKTCDLTHISEADYHCGTQVLLFGIIALWVLLQKDS